MRALATTILRLLALVGKELVEVVRRPGALVSLVLGPFLIMAIFGLGYSGERRPLETVVVIPDGSGLDTDAATYQDLAGGGLHIAEVTTDVAAQSAACGRAGRTSWSSLRKTPRPGSRPASNRSSRSSSTRSIRSRATTPGSWPATSPMPSTRRSSDARSRNRRAMPWPARRRRRRSRPRWSPHRHAPSCAISPAPSRWSSPIFAPAVLALILQHLAVTLVSLALVRERTSGVIELFRVAPVNAWEIIAGKVIAYLMLGGVIAGSTVLLLVYGLGIPMLGDPAALAGTIGLVLLASLGIGLGIAVISDSERQAVQLSLLVLLGSVFFSGFVLSISEFNEPVRVLAFSIPATHGIRLMQDIMLQGGTTQTWEFGALALIALVTLGLSWFGLRRGMSPA